MNAPQKAQSPGGAGLSAETKTDVGIVPELDKVRKIEATLMAEFAMHGHATHRLAEGGYLVCKFGMARHCPDLRGLAAFARQVGVRL